MLEITVYETKGFYSVYKKGDIITIDNPEIALKKTGTLCIHALSTIFNYNTFLLEYDWCPLKLNYFILNTGQNYSYNMDHVFFEQLELPQPKYNLNVGSGSHAEKTGKIIIEML